MKKLTHVDKNGKALMVDVSGKRTTQREAVARGVVAMKKSTLQLVSGNGIAKGDVLGAARLAGIMAAKTTSSLIPLCHPLNISAVTIDFVLDRKNNRIVIESRVKVTGQTGVEMEALTAVAVAALTIYDMCKAVDKEMIISDVKLIEKSGGKSGVFRLLQQS